jgi:hypothetical protein
MRHFTCRHHEFKHFYGVPLRSYVVGHPFQLLSSQSWLCILTGSAQDFLMVSFTRVLAAILLKQQYLQRYYNTSITFKIMLLLAQIFKLVLSLKKYTPQFFPKSLHKVHR